MPLERDEDIKALLESARTIALVGASDRPDRPSWRVMRFTFGGFFPGAGPGNSTFCLSLLLPFGVVTVNADTERLRASGRAGVPDRPLYSCSISLRMSSGSALNTDMSI